MQCAVVEGIYLFAFLIVPIGAPQRIGDHFHIVGENKKTGAAKASSGGQELLPFLSSTRRNAFKCSVECGFHCKGEAN